MEIEFVTLKVKANEYNAIVAGLSKLPYEVSAQVIANLSEQVNAQINPSPKEK
jgi:hypothetical protein